LVVPSDTLERRLCLFACAALLACAGCAAQRADGRQLRVAVLQLKAVGVAPGTARSTREAIGRKLVDATDARVLERRQVDRAVAAEPQCNDERPEGQERCALAVGARLGASHVLVGALGGLGRTFIVQLRVLDVMRAAVVKSLEETRFGSPQTLPRAAAQLAVRLVGVRRSRPWYSRWWVWAIVGAVAAGTAVAIPLAVTKGDEPYEDVPLP
jgi:hypothetical protein